MRRHPVNFKSAKTCIQRQPNHFTGHSEMRNVLEQLKCTILDALEGIAFTACAAIRASRHLFLMKSGRCNCKKLARVLSDAPRFVADDAST